MSIGNSNIHQVSEIPEITKLPNGRLRVVRRFNKFTREDVDNANYGSLMGDFGDLDTEGQQIVNQGYTNLKLISVEIDSRFNAVTNNSNPVLVKTYETLTNSFVQVTDEDQIEELENGTKRLTRVFRAQSGTTYDGDVGTTNAGGSNTSFILAKSDLKDSGAFAELTLTFFEQGAVLSVTEDNVGSQNAIVNEIFNPSSETITGKDTDGNSLSGYSEADRTESNHDGIKTIRVRFLKDNVILSKSIDESRADKPEVIEYFKPSSSRLSSPPTGKILDSKVESNVDGIPTERYTFRKNGAVLSQNWDKIGSQQAVVITKYNIDPASSDVESFTGDSGLSYVIARKVKNGRERTFTFMERHAVLSVSEDKVGSQKAIVNEIFDPIDTDTETTGLQITGKDADGNDLTGYSEADRSLSNVDGIDTVRVRFLKPSILSVEESKNTPENRITVRVFDLASNDTSVSATGGAVVNTTSHILVSQSDQDYEGIKTSVYVFESKDYNTKSTNEFGRTVIDRVEQSSSDFTLQDQSSDYTVDSVSDLKILNQTIENNDNNVNKRITKFTTVGVDEVREDIVGSQKAIVITKIGNEPTASEASSKSDIAYDTSDDWSVARKDVSQEGGLKIYTYTFLLNNTILSESEDRKGSLKTNAIEVFNPNVTIPGIRVDGGDNISGEYFLSSTLAFGKNVYKKVGNYFNMQIMYSASNSRWEFNTAGTIYAHNSDVNPDNSLDPPNTEWTADTTAGGFGQDANEVHDLDFTEFDTTLPSSGQGLSTSHRYDKDGYSLISLQKSAVDGIPTMRYTFAKDNSIISVSEDKLGAQKAIVNEIFNPTSETITGVDSDNVALSGYTEVDRTESDYEGIKTIRVRFLKNDSVLSVSEDFVGSQRAIVNEVFNPNQDGVSGKDTNNQALSGYSEADRTESNYNGIKTIRVRFLKDGVVLSQTEDFLGSQKGIVREVFNPPNGTEVAPLGGYILANKVTSNFNGIPTFRFSYLKQNTVLSVSEDKVGSQLAVVNEVFDPTGTITGQDASGNALSGYSEADRTISEVDGIETVRVRFLKSDVQLSLSVDNQSPLKTEVQEWFNPESDNDRDSKNNYSLINEQESNVGGIPTVRYTFAKDNVLLSVSEDKIGSQNAIVNEIFKPDNEASIPCKDVDGNTLSTHTEADRTESNHDGIKTVRVRFLENNCILSTSEDKVGSQNAVIVEKFGSVAPSGTINGIDLSEHSVARKDESNVDGVKTFRYTFLKNDVVLSVSEDNVGSQNAIVNEVFNPTSANIPCKDADGNTLTTHTKADERVSEFEGIETVRVRFLKNDVVLSRSRDSVGSQKAVVLEVFNGGNEAGDADTYGAGTGYVLAKEEESNVDGIDTKRYTYLQPSILSRTDDKQNPACPITIVAFDKDEDDDDIFASENAEVDSDDYVLVSKTERDFEGIETFEMRFEKNEYFLSERENEFGRIENVKVEQGGSYSLQAMPGSATTVNGTASSYIIAQEITEGTVPRRTTTYSTAGIESVSEDLVGATKVITITKFITTPTTTDAKTYSNDASDVATNFVLINDTNNRVNGVDIFTHRFARKNAIVSTSFDKVGSQKAFVVEKFGDTAPTTSQTINGVSLSGYSIAKEDESNVDGIKTFRYTFLKNAVTLSASTELVGSQKAQVLEVFNGNPTTPNGYSQAKLEFSNVNGIPTNRYTFLKNNVILSASEDLVGSQKAVIIEKFGSTEPTLDADDEIAGIDLGDHVLARRDKSNFEGIITFRYTYLKPSIISVAQDFVEDVNTIQVTAFSKTKTEVKSSLSEVTNNHKLISQRENDHDGITTTTYTFEINTSDVVRYTANNRLQVVRTIYESNNYDYNEHYDVGSTSITFESTTLVLSELRVNKRGDSGTFVKLEAVFTEPGESSRTETTGPTSMPGTEQITIISSGATPVTLTETTDIKLINKQEQNNNGYTVFTRSYIKGIDGTSLTTSYISGRTYKIANNANYSAVGGPSSGVIGDYFKATSSGTSFQAYLVGSITGTKVTYDNIVTVNVPGTVKCKTKEAEGNQISAFENQTFGSAGDGLTSKDQAFMEVVPPSTKKIKASVTESIATSIPNITQLAYNLDNINCSVTKIKTFVGEAPGNSATVTVTSGSSTSSSSSTGFSRNIQFNTNNSYFPGCYLLDSNTAPSSTIKEGLLYRITSTSAGTGSTAITSLGASENTVGHVFIASADGTSSSVARWLGSEALFSYISSRIVYASGNSIGASYGKADQKSELVPTGTTAESDGSAPSTYITTGVIQQKARPVLTTVDGTTYYEVIKFSKS